MRLFFVIAVVLLTVVFSTPKLNRAQVEELMLARAGASATEYPPLVTTNHWADFYGTNTTLNGSLSPVGARIAAYTSNGLKVGETYVQAPGQYLVSVYGDDPVTPEVDGAVDGETISFTINELPSTTLGPDTSTWSDMTRRHIELEATDTPTATATDTPAASSTATHTATALATIIATLAPTDTVILKLPDNWGEITLPTGLVSTTTTFTYTQMYSPSSDVRSFSFAGRSFEMVATDSHGDPVDKFGTAFTITLTYSDSDWQNAGIVDENTLNLFYWNGSNWVGVLQCAGCSLDINNNRLTAMLDHLTEFALMSPVTFRLYSPLVMKPYAGGW